MSPPARQPRASRREFFHALAGMTGSVPLLLNPTPARGGSTSPAVQIENDFLRAGFDRVTGRVSVWRRDGSILLAGVEARAGSGAIHFATGNADYRHTLDSRVFHDAFGNGRQLVVHSVDSRRQLDMELRIGLYDARPALWFEVECRNVSGASLGLVRLEPVCALASGGGLSWPGVSKVLTNGPMYYDPGRVTELPGTDSAGLRSWWNLGFFRGYDQEGLVCGFLENQTGSGQIEASRAEDGTIHLVAELLLAPGFELPPGKSIRSGRFLVLLAADPYLALEGYAEAMGRLLGARTRSIVNGWCNWFTSFEHITEDEVLRNAEFAARTLKPFGLDYIQVDEGFQRWHGEWEGNSRFPHGMQWLADRIRALGLKPGIWIAPYVISEPSDVFQKHPDWLLRHPDGSLKRVGPWPSEASDWARQENPKRYGLDITHPEAAAWLANLFETIGPRWGYEMVKIDFVDWSLLSAHRYHDRGVTRAQAYRSGFEIMRRALGPHCHLQDCGPGPVTVGLLDSMRIELDQNYGFRQQAWKQYFLESTSSAPAAAKRYYFHRRTWVNDADHVCLNLLSLAQAQAAATLLALTGGNLISGDRLPDLDPTRLEILRKIFPSCGEAARPVDLFDTDRHSVFSLRIRKPFGEWTVLGLFNASESEALVREIPLARLGLDPEKPYLAYDFWNERLHGVVKEILRAAVAPASVTLLAIHEQRQVPQVLSTDRHVLQGAVELEEVAWDASKRTLSGVSLGPQGTAHNVAIHLPEPRRWVQGGPFLFRDFPGYTLKMMDAHMLRVRVRFESSNRVAWRVELGALG